MSTPFIHLFRTSESKYMYDVNMDQILKIPNYFYDALQMDVSLTNAVNIAKKYADRLRSYGYLKEDRVERAEHPATPILPFLLKGKLLQAVLQVTQRCNLRCEYCIYSGDYNTRTHSQKDMTWETAKAAMDYLIAHSADNETITLSFYGGEPLIRFDLIKKCVAYMESNLEGKTITYNITTNGTIMTQEIADFMEKYKVNIMFSMDGPENMHNRYRKFCGSGKGSFNVLMNTLDFLETHYPDYSKGFQFNSVIDPEREYPPLSQFVNHDPRVQRYRFNFGIIDNEYTTKQRIPSESYIQESEYEYFQFLLFKAGKFPASKLSKLSVQRYSQIPERILHDKDNHGTIGKINHHGGPCVPGVRKIFVTVDGEIYPCERVSETSVMTKLGDLETGINLSRAEEILNVERQMHEDCRNCWAYRYCSCCIKAMDGIDHYDMEAQKRNCKVVQRSTESIMQDYCVLREAGYDFFEDKCGEIGDFE